MSVTAKTGYGKSLDALGIATLRCGQSIILILLLGLGTDQVAKAMREENNISAWHVNEFRGPDGKMLRANLDKTSDEVF